MTEHHDHEHSHEHHHPEPAPMPNPRRWGWLAWLITATVILIAGWLVNDLLNQTPANPASNYGGDVYPAEIIEIIEEGVTDLGGVTQPYQRLRVRMLEGPYQGQRFEIDYGLRQTGRSAALLEDGQQILVNVSARPEGGTAAFFVDVVRNSPLLLLLAVFVAFSLLVSGWKAVRSLLAMVISLAVILGYILPQILQGQDPVLVSVSGSFFLMAVTLYVVYGWTLKTHAAALGTLISLLITGLLATAFIDLTYLSGFGSEEALFLVQQTPFEINLRGLLLGGMLIGALGVLDDLVITQSSVVFELAQANRSMGWTGLFGRAMQVGRDHVAATVNTLVLAYAGTALPLLLLFTLSGQAPVSLINLEMVAEEIVRTLVGSLGLIAAVPITTAIACWLSLERARLGRFAAWLGPEGAGHQH